MVGSGFVHSSQNDRSQQGLDWRAPTARSSGNLGGYGFASKNSNGNGNGNGGSGGGAGLGKMNSFFGGKKNRDLPVYKDKPYFKPRRTGPNRTASRVVYGVVACFMMMLLYVFWGGWGSPVAVGPVGEIGENLWKWTQTLDAEEEAASSKNVDWEERRERVKDVFTISWDSYEKYGWGEFGKGNLVEYLTNLSYRIR